MAADRSRGAAPTHGDGRVAQLLRWAALFVAVAVGAVLLPGTLRDAGAFALLLLGLPVLLSALPPMLAGRSAGSAPAVTWLAAVASTAWALLLGLGVGLFLLPAAALLLLAALLQDGDRLGLPR